MHGAAALAIYPVWRYGEKQCVQTRVGTFPKFPSGIMRAGWIGVKIAADKPWHRTE
jgi:hypothetical protein